MGRRANRRAWLAFSSRNLEPIHGQLTAGRVGEAGNSTSVPEAWVGRSVKLVFVSGSSTEYADGTLQEVNDRGIVLSVETHVGHPAQPSFYPWSAVIQLSEAREH